MLLKTLALLGNFRDSQDMRTIFKGENVVEEINLCKQAIVKKLPYAWINN